MLQFVHPVGRGGAKEKRRHAAALHNAHWANVIMDCGDTSPLFLHLENHTPRSYNRRGYSPPWLLVPLLVLLL